MAAATVASTERDHVLGDVLLRIVRFTALANTNTYTVPGGTGARILGGWPVSVSTSASVTATWSGQTVTFTVSAGTPDVYFAFLVK